MEQGEVVRSPPADHEQTASTTAAAAAADSDNDMQGHPAVQEQSFYETEVKEQDRWLPIANGWSKLLLPLPPCLSSPLRDSLPVFQAQYTIPCLLPLPSLPFPKMLASPIHPPLQSISKSFRLDAGKMSWTNNRVSVRVAVSSNHAWPFDLSIAISLKRSLVPVATMAIHGPPWKNPRSRPLRCRKDQDPPSIRSKIPES